MNQLVEKDAGLSQLVEGDAGVNQLIRSLARARAPQHILAALEVLQFRTSSADRLVTLTAAERLRLLEWCDNRQLTLMLANACNTELPPSITSPIDERSARYELRFKRLKRELFEISDALDAANLEFVMLKGLSHAPALTPDAQLRAQGDIDLWLMGPSVFEAQRLLEKLGYVPLLASKSRHLPPMGRPSTWRWRGDVFDPEMPVSVELHYELWSEQADYIHVPKLEQFWERKRLRGFDGHKINVLCDEDLVGFAALHLLLHLLHGELPLQRAWEIARFLDNHGADKLFWKSWHNLHPAALRQLEASVFYLVTSWFKCGSGQEFDTDFEQLPVMVRSWLKTFSAAPLVREWRPNKSEVWLHLAFIRKRRDKVRILFRRLLPTAIPLFADRADPKRSPTAKLRQVIRQFRIITNRLVRHLVTFVPTLFDGLRLHWLSKS